ncbi:L-ornithine 5-monooxygenase protein pvdA, partial [Teratosphaeria destructans]
MSPHAIAPSDGDLPQWTVTHHGNGHANGHHPAQDSCLARYDDAEVHDLVGVGFGPASLAIAVALNDALEDGVPNLRTDQPKVRFLEKQKSFAWHAGMLLPGAKMQITFIKDMATLRNPRSRFTFINYLHEKDRLVQFTNLGTFLPQRIEYEDYMRWCAGHFDEVVDYGRDVQSVTPGPIDPATGVVEHFLVTSKNLNAEQRFAPGAPPRSIVVIGAGQSAAEVFNNIPARFPGARAHLVIRSSALRPSDDSPFVNEVFDPSRVDDVYSQDPAIRSEQLARDKATNYAVVRLELLEHIYNNLYSSRIRFGDDEDRWPQRIHPHREILGVSDTQVDGRPAVTVHLKNNSSAFSARPHPATETLTADLVVVAS